MYLSAVQVSVVHVLDGFFEVLLVIELDKPKASGEPRCLLYHDCSASGIVLFEGCMTSTLELCGRQTVAVEQVCGVSLTVSKFFMVHVQRETPDEGCESGVRRAISVTHAET